MWPFRKKKIFRITWAYDAKSGYTYTEWVKAYDKAHAWKQITKKHNFSISCKENEEVGFAK